MKIRHRLIALMILATFNYSAGESKIAFIDLSSLRQVGWQIVENSKILQEDCFGDEIKWSKIKNKDVIRLEFELSGEEMEVENKSLLPVEICFYYPRYNIYVSVTIPCYYDKTIKPSEYYLLKYANVYFVELSDKNGYINLGVITSNDDSLDTLREYTPSRKQILDTSSKSDSDLLELNKKTVRSFMFNIGDSMLGDFPYFDLQKQALDIELSHGEPQDCSEEASLLPFPTSLEEAVNKERMKSSCSVKVKEEEYLVPALNINLGNLILNLSEFKVASRTSFLLKGDDTSFLQRKITIPKSVEKELMKFYPYFNIELKYETNLVDFGKVDSYYKFQDFIYCRGLNYLTKGKMNLFSHPISMQYKLVQ